MQATLDDNNNVLLVGSSCKALCRHHEQPTELMILVVEGRLRLAWYTVVGIQHDVEAFSVQAQAARVQGDSPQGAGESL